MKYLDMVDELVMEVPSVLEPTALVQLRRAARDFCRDSRIWQRPFTILTIAGIEDYQLDPVERAAPIEIEWLSLDGELLDGRHSMATMGNTAKNARRCAPRLYHEFDGGDIRLSPVPDERYTIHGVQSLQPRRDLDEIPDWLADSWGETIIHLAAAKLLLMPNKDWTDPQMAQVHMGEYQKEMLKAKSQATGEDKPAVRVVQYGGL